MRLAAAPLAVLAAVLAGAPVPAAGQVAKKCHLAADAKAIEKVCCSASGSGHRRLQSCTLPATCPSKTCAAAFSGFFESCQVTFRTSSNTVVFGKFQTFYNSCQVKFPTQATTLLSDTFDHGLGAWRGKNGKSHPETVSKHQPVACTPYAEP
jgi:hypothetical protein